VAEKLGGGDALLADAADSELVEHAGLAVRLDQRSTGSSAARSAAIHSAPPPVRSEERPIRPDREGEERRD
jgi:hypothetical protein